MPKLTIEGEGTFEVAVGVKLTLAIEDAGIDILHRCGGQGRCTTCMVEVLEGETTPMSDVEREGLEEPELIERYRLSCQLRVQGDMTVRVEKRASTAGISPGARPED